MPCVYLPGPAPAVTVANSLFITGHPHRKTTWLWTRRTSRKNNGREEKWTSLAVMLYQGIAKKTQANKGHCYAN